MNREEALFQKRLQDLAMTAYQKDRIVFTDFLSMNELSILNSMTNIFFGVRCETFGGYELAERQMAKFVPDALFYHCDYPISILKITPVHKKFSDMLSHRDYLGALLNLGVERSKIGDIVVKDKEGYVYVHQNIAPFFVEALQKVKHTIVQVTLCEQIIEPELQFQQIKGTVASLRADSILSVACGQSRSSILSLFEGKKVFVNSRLTESNSTLLKEGDVLSVRGIGRFIFDGVLSVTKKERYYVSIRKCT